MYHGSGSLSSLTSSRRVVIQSLRSNLTLNWILSIIYCNCCNCCLFILMQMMILVELILILSNILFEIGMEKWISRSDSLWCFAQRVNLIPYMIKLGFMPKKSTLSVKVDLQKVEVKRCKGINLKSSTSYGHEARGLIELLNSPKEFWKCTSQQKTWN